MFSNITKVCISKMDTELSGYPFGAKLQTNKEILSFSYSYSMFLQDGEVGYGES